MITVLWACGVFVMGAFLNTVMCKMNGGIMPLCGLFGDIIPFFAWWASIGDMLMLGALAWLVVLVVREAVSEW